MLERECAPSERESCSKLFYVILKALMGAALAPLKGVLYARLNRSEETALILLKLLIFSGCVDKSAGATMNICIICKRRQRRSIIHL